MKAVVARDVRVKEFGSTELGFSDGVPVTPEAREIFLGFMHAVQAERWAAKTNPVSCTCKHCVDEGYLDAEHERQRRAEKLAKQERLDAEAARNHNRGHWIYDREGREL
jgi:hypothetical protein